jgi:hypothetical protein
VRQTPLVSDQQRERGLVVPVDDTATRSAAPGSTPRLVMLVPLVVLGALPIMLLKFGTAPIADPDSLWHIVAGRKLWSTWQFTGPDQLGQFTQLPFVYHQWLPELLMAAADAVAGLPGVAWLFNAMLLTFVVALYALCRGQGGILAALLATVLGWIGAGGSLSPRPQVIGFILLAMSLTIWLRTERDGRIRWWLIPLTWLWACVHGTWLYSVGLSVLFAIGMLLDRRVGRRFALRAGGLVAALVAVAMLTPVGPQLLLTPFAISRISPFINEWKPTSITEPHAAATLLMGLLVVVAWIRGTGRVSWTRMLLWGAGMVSTLLYARTIAIGAILLAPLVAEVLQRWLPQRTIPRKLEVRTLGAATLLSLAFAALLVPATAPRPADVPSSFDTALAAMPQGTVVWNVDALGGWLLYSHPNLEPTMDTRAEVYGPDYLSRYVRAISGYPGWRETVASTGARYAIVSSESALAEGLQRQQGWTVIGREVPYVLLRAP